MFVYIFGVFNLRGALKAVKVGVTGNIDQRICELQTGQILEIKLIAAWHTTSRKQAFWVERETHIQYEKAGLRGEWFRPHIMKSLIYRVSESMRKRPFTVQPVDGTADYINAARMKQ